MSDRSILRPLAYAYLDAARSDRNRCSFELVLKDISTCGHNPENLVRWERIAMEMAGE